MKLRLINFWYWLTRKPYRVAMFSRTPIEEIKTKVHPFEYKGVNSVMIYRTSDKDGPES